MRDKILIEDKTDQLRVRPAKMEFESVPAAATDIPSNVEDDYNMS